MGRYYTVFFDNRKNSGLNPLKYSSHIGYTNKFEWDRNIEIDEIEKELKDYSVYSYKVMSKKEYEQWLLGNDSKQFADLFSPFVCVFVLYK